MPPRMGSPRPLGGRLADRLDAWGAALRAVQAERAGVAELVAHEGFGPLDGRLRASLSGGSKVIQAIVRGSVVELPQADQTAAVEDAVARQVGQPAERLEGLRRRRPCARGPRVRAALFMSRRRQRDGRRGCSPGRTAGFFGGLKERKASRSSGKSTASFVAGDGDELQRLHGVLRRPSRRAPENHWNSARLARADPAEEAPRERASRPPPSRALDLRAAGSGFQSVYL